MFTDGRTDGRTDEPITIVSFDKRRGTKKKRQTFHKYKFSNLEYKQKRFIEMGNVPVHHILSFAVEIRYY